MPTVHRSAGWVAGVVLLVLVLGCAKKTSTSAPQPVADATPPGPTEPAGGQPTDGKALFDRHCAKCHSTTGGPPKGKMGGPDLSKVAADPEHTADWLSEHVKNPRSHRADSRMPSFEGKLKPEELQAITLYLAGLK